MNMFLIGAHQVSYLQAWSETFDEICIRIPILLMGPHVKQGYTIGGYSSNTDVAPTALNALGLNPGKYMIGKVLEEVYY